MSNAAILGPDGAIARRLRNYESRPQQLEMASPLWCSMSIYASAHNSSPPIRYGTSNGRSASRRRQRKLAFEPAVALAVKTACQRGHGLMQEGAEIGRMLQRLADNGVSQVARRFAAWGHG
jgi:hypothetical protein